MKLSLHAVGRMKNGPEKILFERYWARSQAIGKPHGFQSLALKEYAESKASRPADRMGQEAVGLLKNINDGAVVIALDERGKTVSSPVFADLLRENRESGTRELVFVIGGADGLDASLRERAGRLIAFGAMTWPHQLVRVLLAEQIYRTFSIFSGHPYHKI